MKIKVVHGIDMRLWRYNIPDDKPDPSSYQDLLTFISKSFQFSDPNQFRITYKDEDDDNTTIASSEDFQDAFIFAVKQEKKSLKLYITDSAEKHHETEHKQQQNEEDEEAKQEIFDKPSIETTIPSNTDNDNNGNKKSLPTEEEINAFLADDFVIDLLTDLFVSVFEALQASNFEIAFIECLQGIILSNNNKYDKITSNPIWPYFMNELLPKYVGKIEMFLIPMIRMNGGIINAQMIKQWIPTLLNMMKQHVQNEGVNGGNIGQNGCGNFGGFGGWRGRGRRGWRGRGWRHHRRGRGHHHRGHHGHHHGHHGGHHGPHRGGWRGRGGFGYNPWRQPQQDNNGMPQQPPFDAFMYQQQHQQQYQQQMGQQQNIDPSAPAIADIENNEDDQIEAESFEYTEELVAIMNMGFTNISKIKKLLNEHKGNKQNVVQELVLAK